MITCGGLGPTQDDITREAIAEIMGVSMLRKPEIGEHIRHIFEARGRVMPENNLRQADVPEGASVIAEMPGTAPGLICPVGHKVIYAVPGVPHEMRTMMTGTILPDLQRRAGVTAVIKSRVLKTWGHSESGLAESLDARITELDARGNPTLAFQASGIEGIKVRITAKADDEATAEAILGDEESQVRAVLGDYIFAVDEQTMESVVLDMLREQRLSFAVAEVTSGGLLSTRLTALDRSGEVFRGSVIPVAGGVRETLLGVPADKIATEEAGSGAGHGRAHDLWRGYRPGDDRVTRRRCRSMPTYHRGRRIWASPWPKMSAWQQVRLPGDRERVREFSVISLLNALRLKLIRSNAPPTNT